MTKGIYVLLFEGTDSVYIGQSIRIEDRFIEHCYKLRTGTANKKLREGYSLYGYPSYQILYETKDPHECLDAVEASFIQEFDSCNSGFNVASNTEFHGISNPGEDSGRATLTKLQYVQIMDEVLLGKDLDTVASIVGTNKSIVRDLCIGKSHKKWLSLEYPEKYSRLMDLKGTRHGKFANKDSPLLMSNTGKVHEVGSNISKFSKEHNLDNSAVSKLIKGTIKAHKGWSLYKENKDK